MADSVWMAVEDLIFRAKIGETARRLGIPLRWVALSQLQQALAEQKPSAIVLDLNQPAAIETIRAVKSEAATREVRVAGFLSHVDAELGRAAHAAGCDVVMARSAFSQQLPRLIRELAENRKLTEPVARRAADDL